MHVSVLTGGEESSVSFVRNPDVATGTQQPVYGKEAPEV